MATSSWNGSGDDWKTAADWSGGVPNSTTDAVVASGNPQVTSATGAVAAHSITLSGATLFFNDGGGTVGAFTNNGATLNVDVFGGQGGSAFTITGRLTNTGFVHLGPGDDSLSGASTITVGSLANTDDNGHNGSIEIDGNSPNNNRAALIVGAAAGFDPNHAGTLVGGVRLTGDALLQFASGQIATIASSSSLALVGSRAVLADAGQTTANSALTGLASNLGTLDLEVGAAVAISGGLTSGGNIQVDVFGNQSGSSLTVGSTLTNTGFVHLGPGDDSLSGVSTITVGSLANTDDNGHNGSIEIDGNSPNDNQAALIVGAAAGLDPNHAGTLVGGVRLTGDALLQFASGQITSIASNSSLALVGSKAFVADAGHTGSNSALTGLATNAGTLDLEVGAAVAISGGLTSSGNIQVDVFGNQSGSSLTVAGTLTNTGFLHIGPGDDSLSGTTVVTVGSLADTDGHGRNGSIEIDGNGPNDNRASLVVNAAAGFDPSHAASLIGSVRLTGDALLQFASGQITSIASNSSLALVGSEAFVADAGHTGSNSALTGLATNAGTLDLELGATISTTGNLNSTNRIQVDVFGREGGSHLTVGGTLSNSGSIQLGPGDSSLSADSAIGAAALVNNGSIDLFGGTGGTDATLAVAGNLTNSASHAINVHASGVLTVGGTLTNNGTINDSGTMSLAGAIAGQGTIALGDDSSLELHGSVASGQTIALGASSDLVIDNPASFAGTITGFAAGDAIDFAGRQVADYSFASSLLTVHFQDGSSSSIHLSGDFDSLVKESDGHGGTEIVVPEPDATFDGFYSALSALGNAASDGSIGGTIYGLATQAEASAVENALGMLGQAALGSDAAALWESVHSDSIAAARTLAGDGKASALTDSLSLYNTLIAGAVGAIGGGLSQSVETNVLAAATTLGNHISAGASSTQLRTDLTGLLATMAGSHAGSAAWQAAFNAAAPLADAVAGDAAGSAKLQGDVAALYDKIASGALDALGGSALQNAYAHGGQTIVGLGSDIAQGASAEQLVEDVDTIFGSVAAGASAGKSVDETVGVFQNIVAGAQRLGSTVLAGGTNEQLRLDSQTLMALVESNEVAKRTGDDGQGYSSAANFAGAMMHYISAGASKADLLALSKAALVPVLGQFNDTQWGQLEAGVTQAARALLPQFSAGGTTAQHAEATFLQTILADYITVIGNSSTAKQGAITQLAHSLGIDVGTHDTASLLTDLGDFGSTLFSGLPAGIGLSSEASPGASGSGIQIGPVSITGQQIIDYAMGLGSAGAAQGFLEATAGVFGVTEGVAGLLAELGLGTAAAAEAAPILVGAGVALALDWALVSLLNQLNHTHNTPLGQQAWNALNNWAKNPTLPHIPLPTWGDVHMTTLDGTAYNFQAVGEFVLSESTKAGNSFEVQARMQPWAQGTGVSVMTEIAAKVGSDRVTFDIGRANTVWVDGKAAKLDLNHPVVELDGGAVAEVAPNSYLVTWKTGETIAVTDSGTYLNVTTLLGTGDGPNSVKGLLGPADGAAHAFELADGTVLNQPLTAAELYGEFANSWRVTNKTSLFDYGKGQTTATFTDKDFPAHPITLADLPADVVANAAAVVAAAGITDPVIAQQAELDFLATGDASFIATASQVQAQSAVPTTTLVDPSAAGAPAMAGIGAHDAKLTQATAGTTAVTFEVYLTQAATSDTTIHYAVVGGAGHLGASAFGGTLPSGDAVIRQGQTTAEVTITLPADALGSDASDLLQLAITPPTGIDAFAKTAQTEIVNGTPTRGTDAVPAFVLSGSTGTLTHKGNAWTLDLGKVGGGKTASTTLNFVNTATAGDTMGTPTFRLPAGAAFLNTVLGSQLSIDLSTATAGTFKEVVKVDATESNDSGFSGSLPRQTLTVIAEVTPAPGTPGRDTIVGTAGPDKISGLGGADTLSGAGGNDILNGGTGNDTLNSGSGRDTLNGGPGADKMAGGRGNDTYVVDNAHDKVIEAKNGGTDLVKSAISYKLGANIENLTLTGHKAINGTGNAVANHITGNTAANHLSGGGGNDVLSGANGADVLDGGVGKDILVGGKGNDLFLFDSKVTAANADHIRDFGLGHDRIELENAAFTALTHVGKLAADDFVANTTGKATTTDQHIIYDTKTGGLFYDADGSGTARAGVLFATLDNHAHVTLTAADFLVV